MINLDSLNKAELRAACKEAGIKNYSKMNNAGMRQALIEKRNEAQYSTSMEPTETEFAEGNSKREVVYNEAGDAVPVDDEIDVMMVKEYGRVTCPHCNVHLTNGVQTFEGMLDSHASQPGITPITHEFMCLGCGEEFGEPRQLPGKGAATSATGNGLKIEKNREERNGVKRPSVGGACRAVWDFCDEFYGSEGRAPKPAEVKAHGAAKGWNPNNASIELYQWRKFMGIRGRKGGSETK